MSEKQRESKRRKSSAKKRKTTGRTKLQKIYHVLESFDREFRDVAGDALVGIDEAGRGALAGPVVAAAVGVPRDSELLGINDSKLLTEKEREEAFDWVVAKADHIGISVSQPAAIDRNNILNASLMAMAGALRHARPGSSLVLVDGRDIFESQNRVVPVVGGDSKSLSIAAASVLAKVARDRIMRKLHRRHPEYNFISNKGYGTKDHLEAIKLHGVSACHRMSYRTNVVESPTLF